MRASASAWTSAVGCFRTWKARRWAVFGPIPGSRWSASISRPTDGGAFTRGRSGAGWRAPPPQRSERPRELAPQPAGELRHLAGHHPPRFPERLVYGGEDEVLEHLGVVGADDLPVDLDGQDLLVAVGLDHDHPAARRGVHLALGDFLLQGLQLGLELLRFLHQVAESLHPSPSPPAREVPAPVG